MFGCRDRGQEERGRLGSRWGLDSEQGIMERVLHRQRRYVDSIAGSEIAVPD